MKSEWQVAGVISEFMGVLALPLVIEGLAVRLCVREALAGYWARVSEHPRGMPGSPQNRVRFPEKSHWCASRYLGCLEAVRPGFAPVPGRDAGFDMAAVLLLRLGSFPWVG